MSDMRLTSHGASAMLNAIARLADGGYLRIYGSERPVIASVASDELPLAELRFSKTSFNPTNTYSMRANQIHDDEAARGTGKAQWCRVFMADGQTAVWDASAGDESSSLKLRSPNINKGQRVTVDELIITVPQQSGE